MPEKIARVERGFDEAIIELGDGQNLWSTEMEITGAAVPVSASGKAYPWNGWRFGH